MQSRAIDDRRGIHVVVLDGGRLDCHPAMKHKMENMAAKSSGSCRDEIGESALRRYFNTLMDSFNDLISASMDCRKCSREFAWLGFIENWNGVRVAALQCTRNSHGLQGASLT